MNKYRNDFSKKPRLSDVIFTTIVFIFAIIGLINVIYKIAEWF